LFQVTGERVLIVMTAVTWLKKTSKVCINVRTDQFGPMEL